MQIDHQLSKELSLQHTRLHRFSSVNLNSAKMNRLNVPMIIYHVWHLEIS